MDMRHLRSFLVMAEELHQGRAAARLGIEQPPLSRQIRELEEELGVPLFHRTTRATWLSEAGEALLPAARRMVADEQITRDTVRAGWASSKRLRIGISEGLVGAPVGALLRHLETEPRDVRTMLIERPIPDLVEMLTIGSIDAILAPEEASTANTLSMPAWSEPLLAVVPARIAGRSAIGIADLDLPLFLPDEFHMPGFARQIGALLSESQRLAVSRFSTVSTLYALVGTGCGAGFLPQSLAITTDRVTIRPLRSKRARIAFWVTIRKADDTPAVGLLRDAIDHGVVRASPPAARA